MILDYLKEASVKQELKNMGATVIDDKVELYRGGDVSPTILKKLRYNDYLSTVKNGTDADGNSGASDYGKNIVKFLLPISDIKITNGEVQYIGKSSSISKGTKYPLKIYKAYNDVYGSNYTSSEIDNMDFKHVRLVASQGLSDGRDEFDKLVKM